MQPPIGRRFWRVRAAGLRRRSHSCVYASASRTSIFELPGCRVSSPRRGRCPQGWRGCGGVALPVRGWYNRAVETSPEDKCLAVVCCTGAAMRRPSALSLMRREEGCFSPAVVRRTPSLPAAWSNPTNRGPAESEGVRRTAGPRAFHAPGREVDAPGLRAACPALPASRPLFCLALPRPGPCRLSTNAWTTCTAPAGASATPRSARRGRWTAPTTRTCCSPAPRRWRKHTDSPAFRPRPWGMLASTRKDSHRH